MKTSHQPINFIKGRYITLSDVEKIITRLDSSRFLIQEAAKSVENRNLYTIQFGSGPQRIIMWSQMHGNESTTTKALLDWLYLLQSNEDYYQDLANKCSFLVLPMVNPDGAHYYTRVNANQVDINRDSVSLTQPESRFLHQAIADFEPTLALNLHDQRTIFGVGDTEYPATISFLAPAYNQERSVNEVRKRAMQLIAGVTAQLAETIPHQIGRFDDSFNINCIGDYVTQKGISTILLEAGHFPNDYQREVTRRIVFEALVGIIDLYQSYEYLNYSEENYWDIAENAKSFTDIRIESNCENFSTFSKNGAICIQYIEKLHNSDLIFEYSLDFESAPHAQFGHKLLKANGLNFNSIEEIYLFLDKNIEKPQ